MTERDRFVRARRLAKGEDRCRAHARNVERLLERFTSIGGSRLYPATTNMLKGEWQKFMTLAHRCHLRRRSILAGGSR